jgi:glucokinase
VRAESAPPESFRRVVRESDRFADLHSDLRASLMNEMRAAQPNRTKQNAALAVASAVVQRLRNADGISRIDLAREMGLAPSTIGSYVERLIADGVLREGKKCAYSAGRPATILELNPHVGQFVGVDFEARQVMATAIDFSQESLNRCSLKMNAADTAQTAVGKIKKAIEIVSGTGPRLLGIGVGVPGTVDIRRGIAVHYEFIRGWRAIPLGEQLSQMFRVPVYLDNNIRAMALAERLFGGAKEVDNFVCLGVRSGIGAGVVIDRKLHRGIGNMAGEIGGWPCPPLANDLNDSNPSTLEQRASVRAILAQLSQSIRAGAKSSLSTASGRAIAIEDVLSAARADDALVLKVLGQAAEYLGRTICQINLLLNPEQVIIAGPLAELEQSFLTPIRKFVEQSTPKLHGHVPKIEASQMGEYGGALGAAALAVHHWTPAA